MQGAFLWKDLSGLIPVRQELVLLCRRQYLHISKPFFRVGHKIGKICLKMAYHALNGARLKKISVIFKEACYSWLVVQIKQEIKFGCMRFQLDRLKRHILKGCRRLRC